jgi:hypothetical protein
MRSYRPEDFLFLDKNTILLKAPLISFIAGFIYLIITKCKLFKLLDDFLEKVFNIKLTENISVIIHGFTFGLLMYNMIYFTDYLKII